MLLYNQNYEFIGIDDESLRILNYSTLEELLTVCSDVADLFANQPGYIHNFKNFKWIDFLLHANVDASSAIIHANGRIFSAQLSVTSFYLCQSPQQASFAINMTHIKIMSGEEIKPHIITPKPTTKIDTKESIEPFIQPIVTPTAHALPDYADLTPMKLGEPTTLDIPNPTYETFSDRDDNEFLSVFEAIETQTKPITTEEISADDDLYANPFKDDILRESASLEILDSKSAVEDTVVTKKFQDKLMLGSAQYNAKEKEHLDHHRIDKNYKFDPHVAANELGLPVDLIEEFAGDFIQQAYDFKDDLFEAVAKSDFANLHILSHKLKGVAANLRIEDAFETLSVINTSSDIGEINANLKYYYDIILKLEGKAIPQDKFTQETQSSSVADENISNFIEPLEADDDIYDFGLKHHDDDPLLVYDDELGLSHNPKSIEPAEVFEKKYLNLDNNLIQEEPFVAQKEINETPAPKAIETQPQLELDYNPQAVAKELGIESSFIDELLLDYKNDARIMCNQINQAIKAFDTNACNESAAKLKGISDNLRLGKISNELAVLSKTHDAQEAKKAFVRLNSYLDQL